MNWDFNSIINLTITSLFGIILSIVLYQSTKKKYSVPIFIRMVVFGMLGGFFAFVDSSGLFEIRVGGYEISLMLQLTFYGLLFFNFYLFMESLAGLKPNIYRLCTTFGFLLLQLTGLWTIAWFGAKGIGGSGELWLIADIGYDNLALFTCLFFGFPLYWKTYQYTKEIKALAFAISMIIISTGYIIISMVDYIGFANEVPEWLDSIRLLGEIFPMSGIFIFVLVYLSDIDYIYRLPTDHYVLVVAYKTGIPLHTAHLQNKKNIKVEEKIVTGLISSMSMIFNKVMQSDKAIQNISSEDATIQIEEGEHILAIILAESSSLVLSRALKRYAREFEKTFEEQLKKDSGKTSEFDGAKELLKPVFPFFKLKN